MGNSTNRPRPSAPARIATGRLDVDISSADHDFGTKRVIKLVCGGVAGDVKVDMEDASAVVIPAAEVTAEGNVLEGHFTKVYKTGTTHAGSIGAWYY